GIDRGYGCGDRRDVQARLEAMILVDTNILVRFIVNDDPDQGQRALRLFSENDVRVATTVLLECEWVLRSFYRCGRESVCQAFSQLMRIGNVTVDDAPAVMNAVTWHAAGMDFADALHLAQTRPDQSFATFDAGLAKLAGRQPAKPTIEVL
ncbi:MAG: type II toxin-antitoxin system VapC family toxin, partial [Beijerinckiaceae bacterium]